MAGGGGGGGGKRSANAEINLVPYIDLLSTLICFLLITAVWQQVSVISTNSAPVPPVDENAFNPNPTPPDPNKIELSVKILSTAIEVTAGKETKSVNHLKGEIDKKTVRPLIEKWKKNYPDKVEVTINSEAKVPYKLLIETMDILIEKNYTGLAINTAN
jgi:biopolymer transport protein TolR